MRTILILTGLLFAALSTTAQSVNVTFRVNMSEFGGTIDASGMHLAGSFPTGTWTPSARPMTNLGNGIWSYSQILPVGFQLQYKFVLGNDWPFGDENVSGLACSAPSTSNRALTVSGTTAMLPAVCWNSCNTCGVVTPTSNITFQVDMSQQTIDLNNGGVSISGSFNGFAKLPMVSQGNGIYAVTIPLATGNSVQYKFRNGDAFENPLGPCASGDFGNRVLLVPSSNTTLAAECYSACGACVPIGANYNVTFQVNAAGLTVPTEGLHIAGTFNGFTPTAMINAGGNIYSFTASIPQGSTILWKYLNGNSFDFAESVPEVCGSPDGFGGFNRTATGPSQNTTFPLVCFGSCDSQCAVEECLANGGTLSAPSNRSFCVATGSPAGINVTVSGAVGTNQRWALINATGNIIETRSNNSLFNLDNKPAGNYSIRYIRFENNVTNIGSITNISQVGSLVGCYGVATNAINIFLRTEPNGGTLSALSPTTVCTNAGSATAISVAVSGNSGEFNRFGLTSAALGQQILLSNTTGNFNLIGLSPGNYAVTHISYQQGVSIANVQFPSDLEGCYDLSNSVSVTIQSCGGASLTSSPNPTSGPSFVTFTSANEDYATLEVYDMNGRMVESLFNQVTTPEKEYRLEFSGANLPNGIYLYRLTTGAEVMIDKFMIAR